MTDYQLLPSILAADIGKLVEEVQSIDIPEIEYLHIDVMDGHFVPNITMGPAVVKALKKYTRFRLDVHLMISNAEMMIPQFAEAGADILTIHQEAVNHLNRQIHRIKEFGIKAGVSLNPATMVDTLSWVLTDLDLVLLMSVNPGFGGQKFIPAVLEKAEYLQQLSRKRGANFILEMDGGIDAGNAGRLYKAGVRYFVAGTAVFSQPDRPAAIREIRAAIEHGRKQQTSVKV